MRQVFFDTVGFIALWDSSDQWHLDAITAMKQLRATPFRTVTTDLVMLECGNASSRRPYRSDVCAVRKKLLLGEMLHTATEIEIEQGWDAYEKRYAAGAGIVDQISFLLMRRLGITEVFSNDEHFRAAGFITLF